MQPAHIARFAVLGLGAIAVTAALSTLTAAPAHALCAAPPVMQGGYVNVDSGTRSIASARIRWGVCADTSPGPAPTPHTISMWGRCHPTNCAFGRVPLRDARSVMTASYVQSFAVRNVTVRQLGSSRIEITMHTRFTDGSGRAPYTSVDVLRKVD